MALEYTASPEVPNNRSETMQKELPYRKKIRLMVLGVLAWGMSACTTTPPKPVVPEKSAAEPQEYSISLPLGECVGQPNLFRCALFLREKGKLDTLPLSLRNWMGAVSEMSALCTKELVNRPYRDLRGSFDTAVSYHVTLTFTIAAVSKEVAELIQFAKKEGITSYQKGKFALDPRTGIFLETKETDEVSQQPDIQYIVTGCSVESSGGIEVYPSGVGPITALPSQQTLL